MSQSPRLGGTPHGLGITCEQSEFPECGGDCPPGMICEASGPDNVVLPSPTLPPEGDPRDCDQIVSQYEGVGVHALFPGGVDFSDPKHKCFRNVERHDDGVGNEIETFDSIVEGTVDLGNGPMPVTLVGPVMVVVFGKTGNTTGTFQTEMVSMSLMGDMGGLPIEIRKSPSLPSPGQTSITDLGGGQWQIDSFFDVFTEVSIAGGPFQPQTNGPGRMVLVPVDPGVCECMPDEVACELGDPPMCDGLCPNPGETCSSNPLGGPCFCMPPVPCEQSDPSTCDGICPDPTDVCTPGPAGGPCFCAQPPVLCEESLFPDCSGECPPDTHCEASGADSVVLPSPALPAEGDPRDCDVIVSQYEGVGVHALFPGGVDLSDPKHKCFRNVQREDDGAGNEIETFDSIVEGLVDLGGGPMPVTLTGPVKVVVFGKTGNTTGTFQTEIVSMSLTGDVGGISIEIRESPSLAASGQTSITDLGGGQWEIDSFFDVFTELSVNGGPFQPQTNGPGRMVLVPVDPAVCECVPDQVPCEQSDPATCDGLCPNPGEVCTPNMLGAPCFCAPPCQSDADCDDGDPCTTDICLADGTCQNTPKCTADEDCDDGDVCTTDTCRTDGCCDNARIPGCCASDADCPGKCDICDTATNTCVKGIPGCCDSDDQCTDFATKCRPGVCDLGTNTCVTGPYTPTECCEDDSECTHFATQCRPGLCDPATNRCFTGEEVPDCCELGASPNCDGLCLDPSEVCTSDPAGGPCFCAPPPVSCDQSPFPQCVGDCPAGAVCTADDLAGHCRCDSVGGPCTQCGPGPHFIDQCGPFPPVGTDLVGNTGAVVGIDLDFDCIRDLNVVLRPCPAPDSLLQIDKTLGPIDDSVSFPGTSPVDGHPTGPGLDVIDTEIVSMCLTNGAVTLVAGAGGPSTLPLQPSLGYVAEDLATPDPAMADSLFNVYFEVSGVPGGPVYNQIPLQVRARIDCLPPAANYLHPVGICIPLTTKGACGDNGDPCVSDLDCPGSSCDGAVLVANLVSANHSVNQPVCNESPFPECGGDCPSGMACTPDPIGVCTCAPIECAPAVNGTACIDSGCDDRGECLPRCMNFDPQTGETSIIDCECRDPSDCHVTADSPDRTGNPCQVPNDGTGTITLPPAGCEYLSPDEIHEIIDGLPPGTTIELDAIHKDFICRGDPAGLCSVGLPPGVCEDRGGSLGGHVDCFDSTLELQITGTGLLAGFTRNLWVPISCEVHTGPRNPGDAIQTFPNEMVRLQGELFGDPDFCTLIVTGGSDYGLPSPGQTTLTRLPSGDFNVDSFFDITYEIKFQGCPGSQLEGFGGSTTATLRMRTGSGPTPPSCAGICPPNTVCEQTVSRNTDGTLRVCCDCIPEPPSCGPTIEGMSCEEVTCPIETDKCVATVVRHGISDPGLQSAGAEDVSGGFLPPPEWHVVVCDCLPDGACHVAFDPAVPAPAWCEGECPQSFVCNLIGADSTGDGIDDTFECRCAPEPPVACCSPLDGACLDLTPTQCVATGGIPQGPGTTCDETRCPAVEIDKFPFSIAAVELSGPLGVQLIQVRGSATARVLFEGPQDGDADDDDGNNLEEVATEMTDLELRGHSPVLGVVVISLNPFIPSPGEIEETANNTAGRLDLPPFTSTGTAISFFDMHFQIDLPDLGIQLFTIDPKRMSTTIAHKPPGPGALYENVEAIPLYDAAGNLTEYSLIAGRHWPRPRCETGDTDDDGDLDLDDFGGLYSCLKGPVAGPIDADCIRCFDYDNDGDVDLFDVSVFLRLFGALP